MARLAKSDLLVRFEEAVRLSGWSLLYLSKNSHPAEYKLYRGTQSFQVKLYIWNITHGGATRAVDEYRIQITGIDQFELDAAARNLILGWWDDASVFAGWDIRQHLGPLGASPSMQVSEGTLRQALLTGFAPYINRRGETAIAVRPDFMGTYVEFLEPIHDSGNVPAEAGVLEKLSEDPDVVPDEDIENKVAEKRKYAVLSTKRALRALDFGRRVLSAYDHGCAMCGVQLRLVDGAHILPVADPDSTDQTANGVALCALHHRAYDRGLVTFDEEFKVSVNRPMIDDLKTNNRAAGVESFQNALRAVIFIPASKGDRPNSTFVKKANQLRGW